MTSYISLFGGSTAEFVLRNRAGNRLDKVQGPVRDTQPQTLVPAPQTGPLPYPLYEVVTIGGITEVIEHRRREPIFYITDDSEIKRKLHVE